MPARFALSYKHTNKSARTVCCGNRKQPMGDSLFVVQEALSCLTMDASACHRLFFLFSSFVPPAKLPPIDRDRAISKLRWRKLCILQKKLGPGHPERIGGLCLCYSCSVKLPAVHALMFKHGILMVVDFLGQTLCHFDSKDLLSFYSLRLRTYIGHFDPQRMVSTLSDESQKVLAAHGADRTVRHRLVLKGARLLLVDEKCRALLIS